MLNLIPSEEIEKTKKHKDLTVPLDLMIKSVEMFNAAAKLISPKELEYLTDHKAYKFAESLKQLSSLNSENVMAVPMFIDEPTLTVAHLAEQCGVSEQIVRKACRAGDIKAKRGKKQSWIIPQTELLQNSICLRWLAEKQSINNIMQEVKERLNNELWYDEILKTESSYTDLILKDLIEEHNLEGRDLYLSFKKNVESYKNHAQDVLEKATKEARNKKQTQTPKEKLAALFQDDDEG